MARSFSIAFPVVERESKEAYPIKVTLERIENGSPGLSVWFKGYMTGRTGGKASQKVQLASDYPFTEKTEKGCRAKCQEIWNLFRGFSRGLAERQESMRITFLSDKVDRPRIEKEADGHRMAFTPSSAGVVLSLLQSVSNCRAGLDDTILISAQLKDFEPAKLGAEKEELKAKARLCLKDEHTSLFLHQDDWLVLRDDEDFKTVIGRDGDVRSSQLFNQALDKGRRIFPLSVEDGEWVLLQDGEEVKKSWRRALCELLELKFAHEPVCVSADVSDEELLVQNELPEPEEGSPLALFLRAVSEDGWLPNELRAATLKAIREDPSAMGALKALPPESLANPNLDWNREELFWLSRDNVKKLMPNIVICGPTGSGKTLLAQALLLNALTETKKALYIGPTRALVEEVHEKLSKLLPKKEVVLSTGEECQDDWRFKNNDFDIACVVNEKANVILPMNPRMMDKLAVVVVDEIHMLSSEQRGGPLDMLLVKLRNKQELEGEGCRLRIVTLTTELSIEEKGLFCEYLTRSSDEEKAAPIVVIPPARPQRVLHSLMLYNCGNEDRQKITLSKFSSQDDRQIGEKEALELKRSIEKTARLLFYDQGLRRVSCSDLSRRRVRLLVECTQKARRCLVVVNSKEQIEELADLISKNRGESQLQEGPNAKTAEKIRKICSESCLADGLADELVKQAKSGVFRHHADIPQNLRQVVEELFRSDNKPTNEHTPILFCTETLSYGVNLRADMIVLLSLEFPRRDGSKKDFLSATEYHNILGRVGRFKNEDDSIPEAIVMLSQDYCYPAETPDRLSGYYKEIDSLKSAAIHDLDLRMFRQGRLHDLDCVSFPSFRTVMDALRTAQSMREKGSSYVSAQEVCRVLKDSFYCQKKTPNRLTELDSFVRWMLDSASEMASSMSLPEELALVRRDKDKKRYQLAHQGAALIDTGTSWESLKHVYGWLERLERLKLKKMPGELFLPAFIADYNVFEEMIRPLKKNFAKGRERPDEWLKELQEALREKLVKLLDEDMEYIIEPYMKQLLGSDKDSGFIEDSLNDMKIWDNFPDRQKKQLFLCVILITLCWLNGDHKEMLKLTVNQTRPQSRQENISERRFDRMSWAVQMCRSFFRDIQPVKGHVAEFFNLVLRLRKGVPEKGLPFAYGGRLTAHQIRQLMDEGITPISILKNKGYPKDKDIAKKSQHRPNAKGIFAQVKNFYGRECDRLQKELTATTDDSLMKFLDDSCYKPRLSKSAVEKFVGICKLESCFRLSKDEEVFWLEIPLEVEKGEYFRIHLLNCEPNPDDISDMVIHAVCDLRFCRPEFEGIVFTPCALYTLGLMIYKEEVDEWKDFFANLPSGSIVTVPTVLEYSGRASDLASIMEVPLEE